MEDKTLLKIALVVGAIGLIALFFISKMIKVEETSITELKNKELGEKVKIIGIVERVSAKDKVTFIEISQQCKLNTVTFDNISVKKGEKVEITGSYEKYNGEDEIMIEEIKVIK